MRCELQLQAFVAGAAVNGPRLDIDDLVTGLETSAESQFGFAAAFKAEPVSRDLCHTLKSVVVGPQDVVADAAFAEPAVTEQPRQPGQQQQRQNDPAGALHHPGGA